MQTTKCLLFASAILLMGILGSAVNEGQVTTKEIRAAGNVTNVEAAWPKANEYLSHDCSGPINFVHHSPFLEDVSLDDTSHSVYLGGPSDEFHWTGWTKKRFDDEGRSICNRPGGIGDPNSKWVYPMPNGCVDLDTVSALGRVNCVSTIEK